MSEYDFDPASLDLQNLREITGGDTELEQILFTTYLESSKEGIDHLSRLVSSGTPKEWKEVSHSLKGESANLGALKLAALCQESQMSPDAPTERKAELYALIKAEWEIICGYLQKMLAA